MTPGRDPGGPDRAEVEAAFLATRRAQAAHDFSAYTDLFTEDAVYVEHALGTFRGRERIRVWHVETMRGREDWTFPTEWYVIEGPRVVCKWWCRLPGERPDGGRYEFAGISTLLYAGGGLFSLQEDVYNMDEVRAVIEAWTAARRTVS